MWPRHGTTLIDVLKVKMEYSYELTFIDMVQDKR